MEKFEKIYFEFDISKNVNTCKIESCGKTIKGHVIETINCHINIAAALKFIDDCFELNFVILKMYMRFNTVKYGIISLKIYLFKKLKLV